MIPFQAKAQAATMTDLLIRVSGVAKGVYLYSSFVRRALQKRIV